MNGVAILSKDEQLSKTLLNNGFKQAKGRNRIFIEDSSYSIPFILEHITNNLWAMNLLIVQSLYILLVGAMETYSLMNVMKFGKKI